MTAIEVTEQVTHGLTNEQWTALLSELKCKEIVARTLREVAACPEADADDRLGALSSLSSAMFLKHLPEDPDYPEFSLRIGLEIARGARPRWWKWRRREARKMSDRLFAARTLLQTMHGFGRATSIVPDRALLS